MQDGPVWSNNLWQPHPPWLSLRFLTHHRDAIEDEDYGHGPALRFVIQFDEEDRDTYAIATDKLTPKSKLTRWVKGLFGENALDDEIDIDSAIGMRVEAMFEYGENANGEPDEKVKALKAADPVPAEEPF